MDYLKEIIKKNKILVLVYIGLGILIAFLNNFSADYFQKLIDRFNSVSLSLGIIMIYGLVLIVICILNYVDEYPAQKLQHGIFLDLKIKSLIKISEIDYEAYQTIGTGKLIQRIENGASAGKSILFDFYFCLIRQLIPSILFSLVFIYRINKTIMAAILIGYVVVFIITNLLLKALYQIKEHILSNEEKMNHFLVRGFMEMVVFRINKRFKNEIQKATNAKKEIVNSKVKMTLIHEAFFTIFALMVTFIKVGIVVYGWKTKSISIGSIIALIALVDNAYNPIAIFNVLFVEYKLDMTSFNRYIDFLNCPNDKQLEYGDNIESLSGDVSFDNISFQYGDKTIFNELNFKISHGENIAIVGESGSGKSTLIKLLIGLLKPSDGKILIDNYNLFKVKLDSFYDYIAYVSQESPVFDGTLRENIVFDNQVDEKHIIEVLEKVNLLELYRKMENGLDTELGERGITLSGGERQRLALARLWFTESKLVILDEATSAMDNITEEKVMNEVMDHLKEKTVIVIAHRLNSIKNLKRIIAFKEGKIVGQGSFHELLSNNSYFNELYYTSAND
ncbi:ABC transporter ATP-binding protein [Inconstantimicrobium mannanitabidum]|uniref:Multidrug ABC transporter ATP-binding protein n=1 Tax=Inconstantimicrobium mannanitabidum TaxID=1604901 RepID=A0ACB5RDX4_9CLOT|nr:ABC transporter ATP-binding protein [Clostridium sp. TW13]GKX67470.1 multidrug ABC transporter ATP-binding protein [Clostridium sp. TW13]